MAKKNRYVKTAENIARQHHLGMVVPKGSHNKRPYSQASIEAYVRKRVYEQAVKWFGTSGDYEQGFFNPKTDYKKGKWGKSVLGSMKKEELERTTENFRSEYSKGRVSENTAEELKKLNRIAEDPAYMASLSYNEVAKLFVQLNEVDRRNTVKHADLTKASLEVLRTRFLNSSTVPDDLKALIRKGDLLMVDRLVKFINTAKKRAGRGAELDYDILTEDFYNDASNINNIAKKLNSIKNAGNAVKNFLQFAIEDETDPKEISKLLNMASKIKDRNGNYIFSDEDLALYR